MHMLISKTFDLGVRNIKNKNVFFLLLAVFDIQLNQVSCPWLITVHVNVFIHRLDKFFKFGPLQEKTNNLGFQPGLTQTNLCSY